MKRYAFLLGFFLIAGAAQAQTVDLFRHDPVSYFTGKSASGWVGSGTYFQVNYTDTLQFALDSSGNGLTVRRVLVNADKGAAISRGYGHIVPVSGDSIYAVLWSERSYPALNGVMRWRDQQWVISFDGEWKEWSIRVRQETPGALVAAAARNIPGLRPIELTAMTYRMIAP